MSNLTKFKEPKTVGELKEFLKNVADYIPLGGRGHFGEKLDFYGCSIQNVTNGIGGKSVEVLVFTIEDAGEEPD